MRRAAVVTVIGVVGSAIGRVFATLRSEEGASLRRIRRPGGGRKPQIEREPGLSEALNDHVQSSIRGAPQAALLWVSKGQRHLTRELTDRGFTAKQKLVGRLRFACRLKPRRYRKQANRKSREGASHLEHKAQISAFQAQRIWQDRPTGIARMAQLFKLFQGCGEALPILAREALNGVIAHIESAERKIELIDAKIMSWHRGNTQSRRLVTIPGIDPITASTFTASVPDAMGCWSGRQFSAWIELTSRSHSSGGKERRTADTKQGDGCLRRLLVVGATAVLR
jgi:transposase